MNSRVNSLHYTDIEKAILVIKNQHDKHRQISTMIYTDHPINVWNMGVTIYL
jgi:hypothetical protein